MKTPTEWLFEKLWDEPKDKLTWYALLQQAMDIEKAQIIDAYANGHNDGCRYTDNIKQYFEHAEQYYEETFKNK